MSELRARAQLFAFYELIRSSMPLSDARMRNNALTHTHHSVRAFRCGVMICMRSATVHRERWSNCMLTDFASAAHRGNLFDNGRPEQLPTVQSHSAQIYAHMRTAKKTAPG